MKVGERVMAVSHSEGDVVFIFGVGVYEGDFVPDAEAGGFAAWAREENRENPRIKLDDGQYVYGGECWWGPEAIVRQRLSKYTIQERSIVDARAASTGD